MGFIRFHIMDVSENDGTPKSPILIGFSRINHPVWGITSFGNTHMVSCGFVRILGICPFLVLYFMFHLEQKMWKLVRTS